MSTILKALGRFEEDGPLETSSPGSDSSAAGELRSRILAEERAASGADRNLRKSARPGFVLAVTALTTVLAVGLGVGLDSSAPISNSLEKPVAEAKTRDAALGDPSPAQNSSESVVASARGIPMDADRPAEGHGSTRPLAILRPMVQRDVAEHRPLHGASELIIVRTAWHPSPERRTATVRHEKTGDTRTLREGDAIDGLVLKEISPSAVVFLSGVVEVRLRLGGTE